MRSRQLLRSHRRNVPFPTGLKCKSCLHPVYAFQCCCNCFQLDWPGLGLQSSSSDNCGLPFVTRGPKTFLLLESPFFGESPCTIQIGGQLHCLWQDTYYGTPCAFLSITSFRAIIQIQYFPLAYFVTEEPIISLFYVCDGVNFQNFNCQDGGTFVFSPADSTGTTYCAGMSIPGTVTLTGRTCSRDQRERAFCDDPDIADIGDITLSFTDNRPWPFWEQPVFGHTDANGCCLFSCSGCSAWYRNDGFGNWIPTPPYGDPGFLGGGPTVITIPRPNPAVAAWSLFGGQYDCNCSAIDGSRILINCCFVPGLGFVLCVIMEFTVFTGQGYESLNLLTDSTGPAYLPFQNGATYSGFNRYYGTTSIKLAW